MTFESADADQEGADDVRRQPAAKEAATIDRLRKAVFAFAPARAPSALRTSSVLTPQTTLDNGSATAHGPGGHLRGDHRDDHVMRDATTIASIGRAMASR